MTKESKTNRGGRPAKAPAKTPKERATANLQYALDRAAAFIHDGSTSYARRAQRAARAGIPKETVLRGIAAMSAALNDAVKAVEAAYAPEPERQAPVRRVALGA